MKLITLGVYIYLALVILATVFKVDNPSDKDLFTPDPEILVDSTEIRIQDSIVSRAFIKKDTTQYVSHPVDVQ